MGVSRAILKAPRQLLKEKKLTATEFYKEAYDLHYTTKNLKKAKDLYELLLSAFPVSKEAEYARSQLRNIDSAVSKFGDSILDSVPKKEISKVTKVILTTSNNIPNIKNYEIIEIISAECVFGLNLFKDFFIGVRDVFGGRSKTTQQALRDARRTCLNELKQEALNIGANAVLSVKLDYSEISGQGKGMLFIVATGTAIKISEKDSSES
jgi:uncharacterized protein YbjQ (UPF0145 family)